MHGAQGFATDELALWHPHVKSREVGFVCVQWWLKEQGATVVTAIEDPQEGHGALPRSARHARTVLDVFLNAKP